MATAVRCSETQSEAFWTKDLGGGARWKERTDGPFAVDAGMYVSALSMKCRISPAKESVSLSTKSAAALAYCAVAAGTEVI